MHAGQSCDVNRTAKQKTGPEQSPAPSLTHDFSTLTRGIGLFSCNAQQALLAVCLYSILCTIEIDSCQDASHVTVLLRIPDHCAADLMLCDSIARAM